MELLLKFIFYYMTSLGLVYVILLPFIIGHIVLKDIIEVCFKLFITIVIYLTYYRFMK